MLTLGAALATSARRFGDKPALLFGDRSLSFRELDERVNQAARLLTHLGLKKGDHVALALPNGFEMVELLFACARMGAVATPINLRLAAEEMAFVLRDSDAAGLVASGALLQEAAKQGLINPGAFRFVLRVGDGPAAIADYDQAVVTMPSGSLDVAVADDDPWLLVYTSGTTGHPKGALRSHRSNLMIALLLAAEVGITADDIGLAILPLFHVNSIWMVSLSLCIGSTCALYSQRVFHPLHVIEEINGHGVTYSMFVPTLLTFLVEAAERGVIDPQQLRVLLTSSSPLGSQLRDRILKNFGRVRLYDIYGATELGAVTLLRHTPEGPVGSIGMAALAQDVRIMDEDGHEVEDGAIGELMCAGPTLMDGYYKRPEATAAAFKGDFLGVGDLAYRDASGSFYLVDRKSDMIITSGENVYPAEVENVLQGDGALSLCAVVGVSDERRGQEVVAVVTAREGASIDIAALQARCAQALADYKRPRRYLVWPQLPLSASGKVMRREVRRVLEEQAEAERSS